LLIITNSSKQQAEKAAKVMQTLNACFKTWAILPGLKSSGQQWYAIQIVCSCSF